MATLKTKKSKTKRLMPRPAAAQSTKQALKAINKQYGETLARLAK